MHVIQITGSPRFNGEIVSNIKSLELLCLFSLKSGKLRKTEIQEALYGRYSSKNSAWYPLDSLKKMGVEVCYKQGEDTYSIKEPVICDIAEVFEHLTRGEVKKAVFLLAGPILPNTEDPFTKSLRKDLYAKIQIALKDLDEDETDIIFKNLKKRGISFAEGK